MTEPKEKKAPKPTTPGQNFNFRCGQCGARARIYLLHYQKTDCPGCGLVFWALQPQKDGPLKLYVHPEQPHRSDLTRGNQNQEKGTV